MAYDTFEAARLISWSNKQAGIAPLTEAELVQWIDSCVGHLEWAFTYKDAKEEIRYIDFPTLISLQMICRIHFPSSGSVEVELGKITAATPRLRQEIGVHWPFASIELWHPFQTILSISDRILKTRKIKTEWECNNRLLRFRREGRLVTSLNLEFGEDRIACAWLPTEDIKIDPQFVSGSPCLAGTRIPTGVIAGMVRAGDTVTELADWYELSEDRIKNAVKWENQLAAVSV